MWLFCQRLCTTCKPGVLRGQKRLCGPLSCLGAGKGTEIFCSVLHLKPSLLPASELWPSFTFQLLGSTVWSAHRIVCSARNGTQARLQGTPEKNFIKSQQPFNGVSFRGDIVRTLENLWSCLLWNQIENKRDKNVIEVQFYIIIYLL